MYLKKIEVKGFKSFADRTAIQPAFGVTCVVGPNGSGKSNITDAIRWVLGEQGAKVLRGEKMEDIIFSGTGKRASLGFAEVKLVVDNADGLLPFDFEEIEISRRLYRSGESEYRINDTTARLKDIRDLFADTGVGLEGYSIIGQGRIDEIVGASPQDRRLLFDEAAGITAFKMKKAEAEKQLKSAEDDLKEVRIRLEEAEGSIEVLKHEAEKAERYLALSGRLREIKINEYAEGYQSTRKLFERASAKLEESDAQSRLFSEQREECEARRDSHVSMLQEAQAKLRATDKERYELAGRIRVIDTDLLLADEKRHGIEKQLKSLASRGATGVQAYEKKVAARAELEVEVSQRRESLEVLKREIDEASASMGERFAKLAQLKASVEEKRRAERDFLTEMDRAHARKAENERLAGALEVEHAEMRESALQEGRVSELREKLDDLIAEGAKFADGEAGLSESLISVRSGISHLEKDAVRLRAEAGFHRDSMDSFSDYEHAVQTLMKNKSSDILGVVGELFRVDKKYEDAIETALGRNIGVLVCEKAETAKKYIEEMRASRGGRVSFMPLEDVREGEKPDFSRFELKEGDFEGLAADLITCDEKFRPVFNVLLGSILVASDFEAGRRLLKLGKRVVTLRGEVFIPGGIVTGGATARSGRILSRRRLAEESEERLAAAERELRDLKAEERRIQEETEALRSKVLMHENLMSKTRLELALAETEFETRRKEIQDKKMRYESEKKRLGAEREEIAELIRISAEGLSDAQKSIEEGGVEIAALEHVSGEKTEELTRLKVEQARATEQYSAKSDEIERLSGEIAEFESEQSGINEEVERLQTSIAELNAGKASLESDRRALLPRLEEFAEQLTALEEAVASAEGRGRELSAELKSIETQERRAQERAGRYQAECIRAESELARIQSELLSIYEIGVDEALVQYDRAVALRDAVPEDGSDRKDSNSSGGLSVECGGSRSSLLPGSIPAWATEESAVFEEERDLPRYFDSLSEELAFLEMHLGELAGVSLSAIEEYRFRLERIGSIAGEKEEITSAIEKTRGFIAEMAVEIQRRFHEGLEKIEKSFDYAFTRLFGGGEAKIRVVGGEDILSSGVEIIVQPPGKKLRSISLLSGGEKALTAIALLFAFMEQRPSPFYILDEIEAPLDDVNLLKFTEFLKDYSERAQFLVITHRRATMEIADAIFGVTMEEYGVSKVISAKLSP